MPDQHSTKQLQDQSRLDTLGCGAQFSQSAVVYPQSTDLAQYLSSRPQELSLPKSPA
ncbi:hypothetical protein GJ744_011454 [Endocarpon pusillum]|uniref:Uncharacterized protein n=1 Tax=Endocarpon pusillum TaxID=364733 RepID=A0A8H7ACS8_9EURO|nr:hypothetical protein GJ744_011454 [Endocarpon pusillum]